MKRELIMVFMFVACLVGLIVVILLAFDAI